MDLFSTQEFEELALPDAELTFLPSADLGRQPADLLAEFLQSTPWSQEDITVFGKTHPQPRLVAWYGDAGARYRYSGIDHEPLPWTPTLQALRTRLEAQCECAFNSVLLNYYRDHRRRSQRGARSAVL